MDLIYIFLLVLVGLSLLASLNVNRTFKKYSAFPSSGGFTGASAARRILDSKGLAGVSVVPTSGSLTDHYDPRNNTVYLSESVFNSPSVAAVGVAAHEVGHAIQYAAGYGPIKLRNAVIPFTNFTSRIAPYLVLAGVLLSSWADKLIILAYAGLIGYAAAALFQLFTLFSEFDASGRAIDCLVECGIVGSAEADGSRKVLRAAALTYVAAMAVSVVQLLRMISIVTSADRRRR